LPNSLAVLVLVGLIVAWVTSLLLAMRENPVETKRGWLAWLLPVMALLGFPAMVDLLQTSGIALAFAAVTFAVFVADFIVPILHNTEQSKRGFVMDWYKWCVLVSTIGGLAIVTYLVFVEARGGAVACGPSGGCDTVQHSKYATLFGVVRVGYLGLLGYVGILIAWLAWQFGPESLKKVAALAMWGMCLFGALFSIYLTSLEPFVIGATCMWCISSAVLMGVLVLAATPAAQAALAVEEE
jgi:uncharacterized membrane protein